MGKKNCRFKINFLSVHKTIDEQKTTEKDGEVGKKKGDEKTKKKKEEKKNTAL